MKIFRRFGIFLFAALALALAIPMATASAVAATFRTVKELVHGGIRRVLLKFATENRIDRSPHTLLVQACAYATRLAKRERPNMTPGWRMCPSA